MKTCKKCKATKSEDDFHLDRTTRDGLTTRCKPCKRGEMRDAYLREKNGTEASKKLVAKREARDRLDRLPDQGRCHCGLLLPCGGHRDVTDFIRSGTSNLGSVVR